MLQVSGERPTRGGETSGASGVGHACVVSRAEILAQKVREGTYTAHLLSR